jgi:fluoroacetyl-CoA thioesterase
MDEAVGEVSLVVGVADTARAHHSGDVSVLATPRVLALAEQAACRAIADKLEDADTSVGVEAEIHHVKATRVGGEVTARARLVDSDEKNLSFEFTVTEDDETVAYGTHRRVIVDRARFHP